jgi:hypothetical protein
MKKIELHYLLATALALAAGMIGASGHDGWGWCLFFVFLLIW